MGALREHVKVGMWDVGVSAGLGEEDVLGGLGEWAELSASRLFLL